MGKSESPYYPPRAHWYGRFIYLGDALRRRLALDRTHLPSGVPAGRFVAGFLVPGLAIYLRGTRFWGEAALASCALLLMAFVICLGYPAGNYAFGLLLSVHSTGLVYLCEPWLEGARLRSRIFFSLALLVALSGLLYMPARNLIEKHWLVPMQVSGRVVIVQKLSSAAAIHRGDWIAFSIHAVHGDGVYAEAGFGLGPVLASGGDRVVFRQAAFEVNGVSRPSRPHMPASGEWLVPEKHWFVWPDLDITGHGIAETDISEAILRMATIPQDRFVGKPFNRWFWRRQVTS